jgi:hypothetical protein
MPQTVGQPLVADESARITRHEQVKAPLKRRARRSHRKECELLTPAASVPDVC